MGRLSAGVGRRHPVTMRKASLMTASIRWVWAPWHHTAAQSAVECTRLPILAGIHPVELRPRGATLSLARRVMAAGHLLHSALTRPPSANARRFKSRHPFVPLHNSSSVHLTTSTYVRRTGRNTHGMRSGWTTPQDFALSSRHRYSLTR